MEFWQGLEAGHRAGAMLSCFEICHKYLARFQSMLYVADCSRETDRDGAKTFRRVKKR